MKKRFPDPLLRNYELGEKIHPIAQELMRMVKHLLSVVYEKEYEETDDDASSEEAEGDEYLFNDADDGDEQTFIIRGAKSKIPCEGDEAGFVPDPVD
jgi:hypothetical protein